MPLPAKMSAETDSVSEIHATTPTDDTTAPLLHLNSREVPPGGLSYKILALSERNPRIAWVGPHNDTDTLHKEVNKIERANGLSLSTLAEVEHQICQRLPPGYCVDDRGATTRAPGNLALTLPEVISGTMALLRWFFHGSVPTEQIIARSYRCNECPENRPISGCTGCAANALHGIINKIVARPLPSDAVLDACSICHCSLKAKVRLQLADVQKSMTPENHARLWDRCWILAEENGETLRNDPRS